MDPADIEFIAGPAAVSGDEDVLDIGRNRRGIPRWVQALFVVALVGAGIVTVTRGDSGKKPVTVPARPAGSLLADGRSQTPGVPTVAPIQAAPVLFLPGGCLNGRCILSPDVPRDVATAVHDYVPRATSPTVVTIASNPVDGESTIQQRTIESVFGSVDLLVRITRYQHSTTASPRALKPTPPGLASAFLRVEGPSYVVDLEWIGPETQPPPIDALNQLIRDSRLEAAS
jgi:hypothetical protein